MDVTAGEYVLGILSFDQRSRFEERLARDPALREQVARWEALLSRFERGNETAPPRDLWSRVALALDREATASSSFHTVRLDEGEWILIQPGLERKFLYCDPATGTESYLFRMAPGASIQGHHHARAEECLVLEGDLMVGELRLNAGDYHVAGMGSMHPVLKSQGGAVMFVRGAVF